MKPPQPEPHPADALPAAPNRLLLVRELIDAMTRLTGPRQPFPLPLPAGPGQPGEQPAQLALAAAESAKAIAIDAASLGRADGFDDQRAITIWTETLAQIGRIQQLYGLPLLPFQTQASPLPAAKSGP